MPGAGGARAVQCLPIQSIEYLFNIVNSLLPPVRGECYSQYGSVVIEHMFGILNSDHPAENALQSWTKALQILPSLWAVQWFPTPPDTVKWRNLKGLWANAALSDLAPQLLV